MMIPRTTYRQTREGMLRRCQAWKGSCRRPVEQGGDAAVGHGKNSKYKGHLGGGSRGRFFSSQSTANEENGQDLEPSFGIIAAVSRNSVIGVNGDLPWKVPADRKAFEDMTRDKTLIIGRKTLLEGAARNFDHVAHCRHVVVVSRTLSPHDMKELTTQTHTALPSFHVASSVETAIRLAQKIYSANSTNTCVWKEKHTPVRDNTSTLPWFDVNCWVGGGQGIYANALKMPQARYLHLTVMNVHIPVSTAHKNNVVTRFPCRKDWQSSYCLVKRTEHTACDPISFVTSIYERRRIPKDERDKKVDGLVR